MEKELDTIQNGETKQKPYEVKKEQILFDLEGKAKIISTLSGLIGRVEDTHAPIEIISEGMQREISHLYPKFQEYRLLLKEYNQLAEKLNNMSEEELTQNLDQREQAKNVKAKLVASNLFVKDIQFLEVLSDGINTLKKKYDSIKKIGEDNEAIVNVLEKVLSPGGREKLKRNSIKNITINSFNIDVVIEKNYFNTFKRKGNTIAFHIKNSFFNIYSEGEDTENIRKHERVHNILEGFFPPVLYPFSLIEQRFLAFDMQREIGQLQNEKKDILSIKPFYFVDLLHEEMLADSEKIEELLGSSISFIGKERRRGFSTAANEIFRIVDFLGKRAGQESDEEIKKFCLDFPEKLDKKFNKAASTMRKMLFVGSELDQEFIVHSLLVMEKPTKFHRIETYLKSRCGNERYEGYALIYGILFEETISRGKLDSLLAIKEEIPKSIKERLKENILQSQNKYRYTFPSDVRSVEDFHRYILRMEEFYSYLGMEEKFSTKSEESVMRVLFLRNIFRDIIFKDSPVNLGNLSLFINHLNTAERNLFERKFKDMFSSPFIFRHISEKTGIAEPISQELVKAQPFWQVLVDLKLDAIAQKGLNNFLGIRQ